MKKELRSFYEKCYRISPKYIKSLLKRSAFILANRPNVQKPYSFFQNKFPLGCKGGFILSADFELGWAFRYSKMDPFPQEKARKSRRNIPFLVKMFDEYSIPITWATVGHLFLKSCQRGDHDWMHRIPYFENNYWSYRRGDWFDCDPYNSWEKAKEWYAPDLIEIILNSNVPHEIGCHSFSHIDFSFANCPKQVADDEIRACVEIAKKWGINLKSFVFPAGTYGNFEVLKKYGIESYRKSVVFELAYPFKDENGLIVIPSSRGLDNNDLGWSKEYFFWRYKKYIDKAIATHTLCHFWFHPSFDEWFLKNVFPDILKYATERREAGELWIGTMFELAKHKKLRNDEKIQ